MFRSKQLTAYGVLQCLYVDDGAFPFGTREDLQRGMELIYHHFARFGLEMHIGRGSSESKTECVFFPPPQFFQAMRRRENAATTIQRALRRTRTFHITPDTHEVTPPSSNALTLSPDQFPIGCRVTVVPHHPRHGNTNGIVTNHTAKFVTFSPDDSPDRRIRILPKSLICLPPQAATPPVRQKGTNRQHIAPLETDGDQNRTSKEREQDNDIYDKLPETANVPVADGYVSFTRTFRYLGSLINFSLRDDDDITARIAAATAAMGALKEVWRNPHLDMFNKYMLFRAIPMNLLLWGAETWSLRKQQLDQLEIFLHRNIRRILQISMSRVKEERIRNEKVRQMFYSIPCARNMIAARQMDFVGKMIRGPPDRPSRNMITACCDHKRRVGRPQTTGKNIMVENLRLLFKDVNTVNIDRFGSLRNWIHEANDEDYWNQLVKRLLHPDTPLPARPESWGPLPSWRARRGTSERRTPEEDESGDEDDNESNTANDDDNYGARSERGEQQNNSRGREQHQNPPPPPRAPPMHENRQHSSPPPHEQYDPKRWLHDEDFCTQVGRSMFPSLTILGLGLGASETEIKVHYRQLARKYHPDKNNPAITGLDATESSVFFQLLNNAHEYLRERA